MLNSSFLVDLVASSLKQRENFLNFRIVSSPVMTLARMIKLQCPLTSPKNNPNNTKNSHKQGNSCPSNEPYIKKSHWKLPPGESEIFQKNVENILK